MGALDSAEGGEQVAGKKRDKEKWIQDAIKPENRGALRKQLGVKEGETIPASKLAVAANKGGTLGKRARLAQTLGKLRKKKG